MISKNTLPLPAGLGSWLQLLLQGVRHRGQLASLETAEAGEHLLKTVLIATGTAALTLLTGFALTFAIAAAVWHLENRGVILILVACAYLCAAIMLGVWARRRVRTWRPLAATRRQLDEDRELIGELLPDEQG